MSSNSPVVPALSQKTDMSFEKGLAELQRIVDKLESSEIDLETAVADFEQGIKIQQYCQKKLDEATLQVNRLLQDGKLKPLKDLPHRQAAPLQQSPGQDDSLDFSGSIVSLNNIKILYAGDKAMSVGKESTININNSYPVIFLANEFFDALPIKQFF